MSFRNCFAVALLAGCGAGLMASPLLGEQPQPETQQQPASPKKVSDEETAATIQAIRDSLGPEFSVQEQVQNLGGDTTECQGSCEAKPAKELERVISNLRDSARQLEELAAEAEADQQVKLADSLRSAAGNLWNTARILHRVGQSEPDEIPVWKPHYPVPRDYPAYPSQPANDLFPQAYPRALNPPPQSLPTPQYLPPQAAPG